MYRSSTGPGDDFLPMSAYKHDLANLVGEIRSICNKSSNAYVFPNTLAVAVVKVIYKSGEKDDPAKYPPISILPAFSKTSDKIVQSQLYEHSHEKNLLSDCQFGFR